MKYKIGWALLLYSFLMNIKTIKLSSKCTQMVPFFIQNKNNNFFAIYFKLILLNNRFTSFAVWTNIAW